MKSFRELRVWQAGMELRIVLGKTRSLGKQLYALRNSLTRSLMSRPAPVT